ncbi:MAG TPA: hypothetical protein DD379_11370 [Cyanobacteria bacterium UBA11162]|nr:hypothetical protein [Cyanobacteria bacterium UBA11162]
MNEPTEAQYLVINALDTLGLLIENRYDEDTGVWYVFTPSPILPLAVLRQSGEITPIEPPSEL